MTTQTETKEKPAFYIFAPGADGKNTIIGAAFKHNKGNGVNIVIGNTRYVAFPPKVKSEASGESA
jgi:hypothetical protein